jgi:membrane-bound lytic murein transglycosylase F
MDVNYHTFPEEGAIDDPIRLAQWSALLRCCSATEPFQKRVFGTPTAREVGVTDRLDAAQSLRGGARYYKQIKRRLPDDIYEPDRTYMALAAYNIGRGHLEDARLLTDRQGGDPHLWSDVMARLPLLQNSKYYQNLRHGYARGKEAVTYVQNIRHYQGILEWQDIARNKPRPPIETEQYLPEILEKISLKAL